MEHEIYKNIQYETFRYLDTYPNQWRSAEIKSIDQTNQNNIDFDLSNTEEYKTVNPTSDRLLGKAKKSGSIIGGDGIICELCGHEIKYPFPIINDSKKLIIWIGSECISNYTSAKPKKQLIKEFKQKQELQIQRIFDIWVILTIDYIENSDLTTELKTSYYNNNKQYKYIKYNYFIYRNYLNIERFKHNNIKPLGKRKILNIMKQAKQIYKIPIPKGIELPK